MVDCRLSLMVVPAQCRSQLSRTKQQSELPRFVSSNTHILPAHDRPRTPTLQCGFMFKVASWNLNSVRSRLTHVTAWLKVREPDVLLLQELKGTEFPSEVFQSLGYESVAVAQKAYNGVATLSRHPMKTIAKALVGDDSDSHARFLEVSIRDIRIVNVYAPNGNPVGSEKFAYKLAWMDRLTEQMIRWKQDGTPTLIGGDFNVIPEDIDCHKPSSWEHDALFQPEPRARYRAMLEIGYTDAFPVFTRRRNGAFYILGLLSAGFPTQSRHTNRSLLIVSNAG